MTPSLGRLETPVAFFLYRRPELTRRVFDAIRAVRPRRLLVVADGPRDAREKALCHEARAVVDSVDWPCEVQRHYARGHLGCRSRMASGIRWVFEQAEEAILLEDDCLPHPTFFRFCEELLDRYRDDDRVALISGNHFSRETERHRYSYRFSRYPLVWGWAGWRRAWRDFDERMSHWPEVREGGWLAGVLASPAARSHWTRCFDAVHRGELDSWAYPWILSCWMRNRLAIHPRVNLVSNIGFGRDATHTRTLTEAADRPLVPIRFPLRHPPFQLVDARADAQLERTLYHILPPPSLLVRAAYRLGRGTRRLLDQLGTRLPSNSA